MKHNLLLEIIASIIIKQTIFLIKKLLHDIKTIKHLNKDLLMLNQNNSMYIHVLKQDTEIFNILEQHLDNLGQQYDYYIS